MKIYKPYALCFEIYFSCPLNIVDIVSSTKDNIDYLNPLFVKV